MKAPRGGAQTSTPHLLAHATLRLLEVASPSAVAFADSHTTRVFAGCHTARGGRCAGVLINPPAQRPPSLIRDNNTSPKLTNTAQCETPDSHMRDASAVSCVQITIPFEVMCP